AVVCSSRRRHTRSKRDWSSDVCSSDLWPDHFGRGRLYTTHIKKGQFRANGLAQSDQATVVEHFIRHGERMTYFSVVNDPVNLDRSEERRVGKGCRCPGGRELASKSI